MFAELADGGRPPPRKGRIEQWPRGRFRARSDVSAMGTLCAHLQSLITALRTRNQVALWADQNVNDEADQAGQHDENHPEDGVVHAPIFRILCNPDQQRDVQSDESDDDQTKETETAAGGGTTGSVIPLQIG
jgi:hypothetical protein